MIGLVSCRLNEMPRWPGLNHFKSLGSMGQFADGTKFEDHSKVCLSCHLSDLILNAMILGYNICESARSDSRKITGGLQSFEAYSELS